MDTDTIVSRKLTREPRRRGARSVRAGEQVDLIVVVGVAVDALAVGVDAGEAGQLVDDEGDGLLAGVDGDGCIVTTEPAVNARLAGSSVNAPARRSARRAAPRSRRPVAA